VHLLYFDGVRCEELILVFVEDVLDFVVVIDVAVKRSGHVRIMLSICIISCVPLLCAACRASFGIFMFMISRVGEIMWVLMFAMRFLCWSSTFSVLFRLMLFFAMMFGIVVRSVW